MTENVTDWNLMFLEAMARDFGLYLADGSLDVIRAQQIYDRITHIVEKAVETQLKRKRA